MFKITEKEISEEIREMVDRAMDYDKAATIISTAYHCDPLKNTNKDRLYFLIKANLANLREHRWR